MYCKYCGVELEDNSRVCPFCGGNLTGNSGNGYGRPVNSAPTSPATNYMAIIGFVLAFLVPVAGLVCSIIGYSKFKKEDTNNGTLALAGIIISAFAIVLDVIVSLFVVIWAMNILSQGAPAAGVLYVL